MLLRLSPTALMLGNFAVATSIMAPTAMLQEVSNGLGVSIREASYLVAFGSLVLCIGSPLTAWLTSRIDRRILLTGCIILVALGHFASAVVTSFWSLLAIRMVMMLAAAPYTAQAAGTVGLLVPEEKRSGAIVYVFLGWSLALAIGLPAITYLASRHGWQAPHLAMGALAIISATLIAGILPQGLKVPPLVLETWAEVFRQPSIMLLLLLTTLLTAGQFVIITFIGPLLIQLAQASSDGVGFAIGLYGVMGVIGTAIATYNIRVWGVFKTAVVHTLGITCGIVVWALGAGSFAAMATGVAIWGLGFAGGSSLQQARLVSTAPLLSNATVALNTSMLYVGQAIGASVGGLLFERGYLVEMGYVAAACMLLSWPVFLITRPKSAAQAT